jgi:hypothetical protein
MRIVTWNCARGPLGAKRAALASLNPDVAVLTEASRPTPNDADVLWHGEGKYGVAIYAGAPFVALRVPNQREVPCVYPVHIAGPITFTLIGVWTWPVPTYKKALMNGLDAHANVPRPWVVAGDFNGNVNFDRIRSQSKWRDCFGRLQSTGLVSAYHAYAGCAFGEQEDPTHYFRWHENKPFHLDYCFVPAAWKIEAVSVGSYADWKGLSDHRPVVVDVVPHQDAR